MAEGGRKFSTIHRTKTGPPEPAPWLTTQGTVQNLSELGRMLGMSMSYLDGKLTTLSATVQGIDTRLQAVEKGVADIQKKLTEHQQTLRSVGTNMATVAQGAGAITRSRGNPVVPGFE